LAWLLLAALLATAAPAGAAGRRTPTLAPANTVLDGPSANIVGLSGMAIANDGTGGLIYLKDVQGVAHVFVSSLLGGVFQTPVQLDTGLSGPSSQPVIATTDNGLTLVAFINAGGLYVVERTNALSPWQAPAQLFSGAANPSLSMSAFGKAYLAFTAAGAGGHDVRAAYFYLGHWALEPTPLDANPADDAGTGGGRPAVATAGDGVGIVAWGENGHIYTRRVWATAPSTVYEQADPPAYSGWSEVSADAPQIGSGGDSSYAEVAFHEVLSNGVSQQSRVLINRLRASRYDGVSGGDGLSTPGSEGANQPQIAVTEPGRGFVTSQRDQTDNLFATTLNSDEHAIGNAQVNQLPQVTPADAVPAAAGLISTLIAWQQDPGLAGLPEIVLRYAPDGFDLAPAQVISVPALGPTEADLGLAAGGDIAGDAAVAWVQGSSGQTRIMAGQLFQTPGGFAPAHRFRYATSANPVLAWSPAFELWGAPHYVVSFDGAQIADTTSRTLRTPAPVTNGPHTWQVTAVNQAGVSTLASAATVFVDTVAPQVTLKITGLRHLKSVLHASVSDTDSPAGTAPSAASGVASVQLKWGDGAKYLITHTHGKFHAYQRRGVYTVTVIVKDRAGNRTVVVQKLRITAKPKPKPKPKKHRRRNPARRTGHH
jgi:hypothetical protein